MPEENDGWMSESADSDKVLYANDWLSLRETPGGYTYAHEEKGRGQGVAVLAYRTNPLRIVGRFEECPPHRDGGLALCALTGQIDQADQTIESPRAAAVRELKEEAGIDADFTEMKDLGRVKNGKQTDTDIYLFSVDVGGREIDEAVGDGTRGERGAYCEWVKPWMAIQSKDPLLAMMAARVQASLDWDAKRDATPNREELAEGRDHLTVTGTFQSDKYPWCPAGFVPLKLTDPAARDLLDEYGRRRGAIDPQFNRDLREALMNVPVKINLEYRNFETVQILQGKAQQLAERAGPHTENKLSEGGPHSGPLH